MTDTLSPERVAEIRALAEKATPGPWIRAGVRHKIGQESCFAVGPDVNPIAFLPIGSQQRDRFHAEAFKDAAYIAALDPQTVLALLASHAALVAEVEVMRDMVKPLVDDNDKLRHDLFMANESRTEAARKMRERCAKATDYEANGWKDILASAVKRARNADLLSAVGYQGDPEAEVIEAQTGVNVATCLSATIRALPLEES